MSRIAAMYPSDRVTLREVGLRDGLQLVKQPPSTQDKIDWLAAEVAAGVRHFEIGSFLPAARFPQFADIDDMIAAARAQKAHSAALTLNERGTERALQTEVDELVCVVDEHVTGLARREGTCDLRQVGVVASERTCECAVYGCTGEGSQSKYERVVFARDFERETRLSDAAGPGDRRDHLGAPRFAHERSFSLPTEESVRPVGPHWRVR